MISNSIRFIVAAILLALFTLPLNAQSDWGDINGDSIRDIHDLDLICEVVATGVPSNPPSATDLNEDGTTDQTDVQWWRAIHGIFDLNGTTGVLGGDANLDGSVNGQDFLIWNAWKFTSGTTWSQGDFNCDGITDGPDFVIWNRNKFQSIFPATAPDRLIDVQDIIENDAVLTSAFDDLEPGESTIIRVRYVDTTTGNPFFDCYFEVHGPILRSGRGGVGTALTACSGAPTVDDLVEIAAGLAGALEEDSSGGGGSDDLFPPGCDQGVEILLDPNTDLPVFPPIPLEELCPTALGPSETEIIGLEWWGTGGS